jgi:hypothetical protein
MKLLELHKRLTKNNLRQAELVGFGGVGKTQLAVEYCYRHFGSTYGLIVWLRAESASSIAADLRRFAYDLGIVKKRSKATNASATRDGSVAAKSETVVNEEEDDDEVILDEVHRRLGKCRCKWLFVFDNLEDPQLVETYLPRGQGLGYVEFQGGLRSTDTSPFQYSPVVSSVIADRPSQSNLASLVTGSNSSTVISSSSVGHVIVTSRLVFEQWAKRGSSITIECFDDQESVRFLEVSLNGSSDMDSLDSLEGVGYTEPTKESQVILY